MKSIIGLILLFLTTGTHSRGGRKKIISVRQLHLDDIVQGYQLPSRQVRICLAVLGTLSLVEGKPDSRTCQKSHICA